jgi:hypothetical protein
MLQDIRKLPSADPQLNTLLQYIGRFSQSLVPDVETNASNMTTDNLPALATQFFQNSNGSRMYANINGSITSFKDYTVITNLTADPSSPESGQMWLRTDL